MPQFTNNLEESLQKARQELAVLENLRKQTLAAPTQPRLLEELNNTIKSLTLEEREGLQRNSAYAEASKLYEDGFNSFLGAKFGAEYLETPQGKQAAENLIDTLKQHKDQFKEASQAKLKELEKLADLVRNNPKIKAELDAMIKPE